MTYTAPLRIKGVKQAVVLYSSGSTPPGAQERIYMTRAVTMDIPMTSIDFMGDNSVETLYSIDKLTATVEADKFTPAVFSRIYTKVPINGQTGEETRVYFGDVGEELPPNCGLMIDLLGLDAAGVQKNLRITIYKATAKPYTLPNANSKEKHGMAITFEAIRTDKDLLGSSPPGMPTDGAFYSIAVLS